MSTTVAPDSTVQEVKKTTCYMCACRCGIRVHLRDGQVRYIDGNPDHPLNQGVICAKGSSGIMKQYSPARLLKPLRRKPGAARGAGEFGLSVARRLADAMTAELTAHADPDGSNVKSVAWTLPASDTAGPNA